MGRKEKEQQKFYAVRVKSHRGVYDEWTEVQRIIAELGTKSYGNYKKFTGDNALAEAEAWTLTDPVRVRRRWGFLGKLMLLNGALIVLLYYLHWGITELYHWRCRKSAGSPECDFLYTVQGAVVAGYKNLYLAVATFAATGILALVNNLTTALNG